MRPCRFAAKRRRLGNSGRLVRPRASTVYKPVMSEIPSEAGWSPADSAYAVAVSEATWWRCAVQLAAGRLGDTPDSRAAPVRSTQIDARNLIYALVQLLNAEALEQEALRDLGTDATVGHILTKARDQYLHALPGIQEMRNALTHFDEWALGRGRGPQKAHVDAGSDHRDVAAYFWGFGYNQGDRLIRMGPFTIDPATAVRAARDLTWAIDVAAQAVDRSAPPTAPA